MLALNRFGLIWLVFAISFCAVPSATHAQETQIPNQGSAGMAAYINDLCKDLIEKGKTVDRLSEKDLADLPVGIARQMGGLTYVIAIDSAHWTRNGWFFSAYASLTFPGTTRPLAFRATNIAFNESGLAGSTQVKLLLVDTSAIPLSQHTKLRFPSNGANYVEFDCDGYKAVNFKGEFVFDKALLIPDAEVDPQAREVTASFEIHTSNLHDIMTTVVMTPFKLAKLRNLSFQVKDAIVDHSDLVNPPGFSFPRDYQQTFGSEINLWHGFFLKEVAIRFHGLKEDGTAPTIAARNLIIDELGVSGIFSAYNLMGRDESEMEGWGLSVDSLSVQLLLNNLKAGSLAGKLGVPMLGKEPVDYAAMIEQGDSSMIYRFTVGIQPGKEFRTPFGAVVTLDKGSTVSVESNGGRLIPSAMLHGKISFENKMLTARQIAFQNLHVTRRKPYVLSGEFATVSEGGSGVGFPIYIDSIRLRIYQGEVGIGFAVGLNFMDSPDKGFAAITNIEMLVAVEAKDTTVVQVGETQQLDISHRWALKKVRVTNIKLDCATQAFTLKGELGLYDNDPVYGDGFKGSLTFSIKKILERGIRINAYFGSKPTYRYWHVDAYVPTGNMLIVPPALFINGIIGGASYHMVRKAPFTPDFNTLNGSNNSNAQQPQGDQFVYIPDEKVGIAFMAGVTLVAGNERAFNSDAVLEVAFNKGGGIRYAQFDGTGYFFTGIDGREKTQGDAKPAAPAFASLSMLYDNDNDVFHANLKTYVNINNVIKGTGPGNLVGEAVIHIDKKDWYMYIGRPSQMMGLDIARIAVAQSYFMVGTKVENLPLPPPEVQEVFDDIDMNLMRDETALVGGKGFATGVHFRVGFDSKDKLMPFYASLTVGAGADIMLRNYGNAYCAGQTDRVGISGWYASGQAYVFLNGRVGIRVRKVRFDFLHLGAAALLQAKLPNPTWLKGQLGGRYSVLGGLVKGKFNISLEVGDECELINPGGELDDIEIIADVKPDDGSPDVSVFTAAQASFNTAVDTEFNMMDVQDNLNAYRIRFGEFTVKNSGTALPGRLEWNSAKDVVVLRTNEILPPKASLTATASIYWEKKNANGVWEVMKEGGQTYYEKKERSFTTGAAPDFIPEENVAYSYPVKYQYNLHVKESGQGYVKLGMGQAYLFTETSEDGTTWTYSARFKDTRGTTRDVPLSYDVANAQASFVMPDDLSRQTLYTLSFIKTPQQAGGVDKNLTRTERTVAAQEGSEVAVASNQLEGTITQAVDKEIYATAFRTSAYDRFADKMATLSRTQDIFDVAVGTVAVIGKRGTLQETFDDIELSGRGDGSAPLIQLAAGGDVPWMRNLIGPKVYADYPVSEEVKIEWRDPVELGVKPLKGVVLKNEQGSYKLSDANLRAAYAPVRQGTVMLGYFVSYYAYWDYAELSSKAAALYLDQVGTASPGIKKLLTGGYIDLVQGEYPVEIKYVMPGTNQVTYSQTISIRF